MRLLMVGLNHRTADVALREKVALNEDALRAALAELSAQFPQAEFAIVSTCNRTEIYAARPVHQPPDGDDLRTAFARLADLPTDQLAAACVQRDQLEAIRHLLRVASGLDSMVLGEPQVLGQVKQAYETATDCHAVRTVLHQIFQSALTCARQVRRTSGIGEGRVSVGSVAVDFARQIFEDLSDKTVLGIGAGEMVKGMLRHLHNQSPRRTWLTNRTAQRAVDLARELGIDASRGGPRPWDDLETLLVEADIVLTCTAAAQPIIRGDRIGRIVRKRRRRPLFIIDIAVPRDVEPVVGSYTNVYLYNIDDLQSVISANMQRRGDEIDICESMINDAAQSCLHELQHRDVGRLIHQLRAQLHELGRDENERTLRKLAAAANGNDHDKLAKMIDEHTHRLVNKILHMPLSQLNPKDRDAPLGFYAAALRRLFDLDDPASDAADVSSDNNKRNA